MPFQRSMTQVTQPYYQEVECRACGVSWSRQVGYNCWHCGKYGKQVQKWELYAGCKQTVNWDDLDRNEEREAIRDRNRLESLLLVRGASSGDLEDVGPQEG